MEKRGLSKGIVFGVIVALAIIILIVFIVLLFMFVDKDKTNILKDNPKIIELKQDNFTEVIKECEKIEEGSSLKNHCIKSTCELIGTQEEKIQECMKIDEDYIREKYTEMGMELPEITGRNINSARDSCFFGIIPRTIETCTKISYIKNRDNCLNYIEPLTMGACDSISDSNYSYNSPKDRCYKSLAEKKIDDSICDKISDNIDMRVKCYMDVGILKKEPKVCEKIEDYLKNYEETSVFHFSSYDKYKNRCLGGSTGDISKCGNEETADKYHCYIDVAKNKDDLSICDLIKSKTYEGGYDHIKANCYMEIADLRNDSSLCDKEIIEERDRDLCYLSAVDKLDESFCEKLSSSSAQANCYSQLAKEKGDLSLCNKMSGNEMMFYPCYTSLIRSASEKLNENFGEEDKALYDKCCQSPYDCEDKNKTEDFGDPRCSHEKGEYELRVYDSQGRITGEINGVQYREIPHSSYFSGYTVPGEFGLVVTPAEVIIFEPNDTYVHEIFGLTKGSYNFQETQSKPPEIQEAETITISPMAILTEEGQEVTFKAEWIPISPNVTHQYHIDWDALARGDKGVTILIDNDNDRIFEKNISVGTYLNCSEFFRLTD